MAGFKARVIRIGFGGILYYDYVIQNPKIVLVCFGMYSRPYTSHPRIDLLQENSQLLKQSLKPKPKLV